jgi:putative FmdB family regulatory protein
MPTYEYACRDCGHTFEIVQKMSDDSLTICPECGGRLRKVFAPPTITFKGSGFYATDHGKKAKTPSSGGGDAGEKQATKETKPSEATKDPPATPAKKEGSPT